MMRTLSKILICVGSVALILVLLVIYMLSTVQIRDTKDFAQIYVDDVFTYEMMVTPPEKYSALEQIDLTMRENVSNYMKENNFVLKKGIQEFVRNNPTFDELVNEGFIFEKMDK